MPEARIKAIACAALAAAVIFAHAGRVRAAKAECEEAVVNPISGHAECVRPRGAPVNPPPPRPAVIKLAVFDFEMEDASPAASLLGQTTSDDVIMEKVTSEGRRVLAASWRYILVGG